MLAWTRATQAQTVAQFQQAASGVAFGFNFMFVDTAGDAAYFHVGRYPIRPSDVDPRFPIERVAAGRLAAFVSRVSTSEFGADAQLRNLNDLAWLERVARAHEAVLENALSQTSLVPLRVLVDPHGDTAKANGGVFSIHSFLTDLEQTCIVYGTAGEAVGRVGPALPQLPCHSRRSGGRRQGKG